MIRTTTRLLLPRRTTHSMAMKMWNSMPYLRASRRLTASDAAESVMISARPSTTGAPGVDVAATVARLDRDARVLAQPLELAGALGGADDGGPGVGKHPHGGRDRLAGAAVGRQQHEAFAAEVVECGGLGHGGRRTHLGAQRLRRLTPWLRSAGERQARRRRSAQSVEPDGVREVRVSSPDRVLWPAAGMADGKPVTKLDLAAYVVAVGDPLLRALGDRPVTLQRFPEGIEGEEFFSKNPPKGVPDWTRTVIVHATRSGAGTRSSSSTRSPTAVWAVQMNTVTFHPWPVRDGGRRQPRRAAHRPRPAAGPRRSRTPSRRRTRCAR